MTEVISTHLSTRSTTGDDTTTSGPLSTSSLRAAIVNRTVGDAVDDRLRRRERLLHQLAIERQRQRRRRSA